MLKDFYEDLREVTKDSYEAANIIKAYNIGLVTLEETLRILAGIIKDMKEVK